MKLYYSPGSCSLASHIVLREAGLEFEAIKVDLRTRQIPDGRDFHEISGKGYVPALELEDGTVLTEGPAILQYIGDQVPESGLVPDSGSLDRYRLQEWLNFIATELHKNFGPLVIPGTPEETRAAARDRLAQRFAIPADALADHDYLLATGFSAADAYFFVILTWAARFDLDLSAFPVYTGYKGRIESRPAVQAAMAAEGLIRA